MTSPTDLAAVRRAFGRQIAHKARSTDARLEAAFATVPRENFLGPGPWDVIWLDGPQPTPDADPIFVYQDTTISLSAEKRLNNGQPSFLAMLIDLCAIRSDDRIVHIGAGTGYYTAILAELAPTGAVLGIEYEPDLAASAARNLASAPNVSIKQGDGWRYPLESAGADVILVNAGTPRFAGTWLEALQPGGRLIVPLATQVEDKGFPATKGVVFLITRDDAGFTAACKMATSIYPCCGGVDRDADAALAAAFETKGAGKVTRLRRERVEPARCWLSGDGWSLTYD